MATVRFAWQIVPPASSAIALAAKRQSLWDCWQNIHGKKGLTKQGKICVIRG
jgi:hypothetical protein